ncbi:alcohol dehydrogenase [Leptospira gomenensis]|uniref:Alcohol dehydrogenase n=1 Tax=Leptospira gomenensis TaxID=2484974 RepID=A0A5F1Y6Q5_9LEPT|nr:zinc-binding dehydrogenase [Leptospira gomenensis]TGK28194.1 alcohol dehydrogenase [Leptospira gomenensis]TGK36952.1 alcohol dehydrogenase [Leptospira gomenensis]TGK45589.1 alcohol dehydrogenase [Leptospira gomenensis]TGK59528.1 alcohol dehydrogenase [Leptospira gomenensis]
MNLPQTYKALELREYSENRNRAVLVEKKFRPLKKGEVLIRIHSASINPSDLMFLRGLYGIKKKLPVVPGFEASGVVVASGGGLYGNYLKGKNVACTAPGRGDGVYAEYMITDAFSCLSIGSQLSLEQGACLYVNPITAIAMVEQAQKYGAKALVQTAAASALGKMVVGIAAKKGMKVINVVRKPEQEAALKAIGAEHILNSEASNFERQLRVLSNELKATVCLDAVAGELTTKVLLAMPYGSRCIVYGALSEKEIPLHAGMLIFQDKKLEGFWLSTWVPQQSPYKIWKLSGELRALAKKELKTDIAAKFPLEKAVEAIEDYAANMTRGKVLIQPPFAEGK